MVKILVKTIVLQHIWVLEYRHNRRADAGATETHKRQPHRGPGPGRYGGAHRDTRIDPATKRPARKDGAALRSRVDETRCTTTTYHRRNTSDLSKQPAPLKMFAGGVGTSADVCHRFYTRSRNGTANTAEFASKLQTRCGATHLAHKAIHHAREIAYNTTVFAR